MAKRLAFAVRSGTYSRLGPVGLRIRVRCTLRERLPAVRSAIAARFRPTARRRATGSATPRSPSATAPSSTARPRAARPRRPASSSDRPSRMRRTTTGTDRRASRARCASSPARATPTAVRPTATCAVRPAIRNTARASSTTTRSLKVCVVLPVASGIQAGTGTHAARVRRRRARRAADRRVDGSASRRRR